MALKFKIVRTSPTWAIAGALIALNSASEAQTGNCVINGGINNGIQIQNCPIVQAAPTPTFHIVREEPIKKNADGTSTRLVVIEVDAPYVPNNMAIVARGPTVTDLNVKNNTVMFGGKSNDLSQHIYALTQPTGQYTVDITTSDQISPPTLEIQFNVPNINWTQPPAK
jgi:hypothetical protein